MDERRKLANLRSSLSGNDKLNALLQAAVSTTESLRKLGSEVGLPDVPEKGD